MIGESPKKKFENIVPNITETAIGNRKEFIVFGDNYKTRDGSCVRDYVHVSDIAMAHVLALKYLTEKKNKSNHEIFNLGTGKGVSVLETIKAFEKISGVKLNYKIGNQREGDVEAIYSDCTKARKLLGWKTKYDIEKMMESAWKWQLNNKR